MKKRFLIIILFCVIVIFNLNAQIEYGYDLPKSSTDPWKFGITLGATYDWINRPRDIEKTCGYKVGMAGDKHLVYNIYFRPTLNFFKKGYKVRAENNFNSDVDGYFINTELNVEMKFGDERSGSGLVIYFAPFLNYGISGNTDITYLSHNPECATNPGAIDWYGTTDSYSTFDEDKGIDRFDLGFLVGLGYDINHHFELNFNYNVGYFNIGGYANYRWRSLQCQLTYFF